MYRFFFEGLGFFDANVGFVVLKNKSLLWFLAVFGLILLASNESSVMFLEWLVYLMSSVSKSSLGDVDDVL